MTNSSSSSLRAARALQSSARDAPTPRPPMATSRPGRPPRRARRRGRAAAPGRRSAGSRRRAAPRPMPTTAAAPGGWRRRARARRAAAGRGGVAVCQQKSRGWWFRVGGKHPDAPRHSQIPNLVEPQLDPDRVARAEPREPALPRDNDRERPSSTFPPTRAGASRRRTSERATVAVRDDVSRDGESNERARVARTSAFSLVTIPVSPCKAPRRAVERPPSLCRP